MALTVTEIEDLRTYLIGVMNRADHHAKKVNEIILALIGAILWRKNDAEPITVMVQKGQTTNVLWVRIHDKRYAFSYGHDKGEIEMREGGTQGPTLHTFTNATPLSSIRAIFEAL
ncbi:MAG: hypothetical protein ABSA46_10260 [Thermodesulfovibrionales bacterium]|jgi:hypothetical protein